MSQSLPPLKPSMKPNKSTDYDWLVKVIILGDSGVGKTNILTQYCEGKFTGNYMATIGVDFKIKTVQVDEKRIKLQIWDTAGQERFRNITQTYYKGAYGIIFAYSITDRNSFANMDNWIKSIKDNTTEDVCSIIVANKSDCVSERKIEYEEGKQLADTYKMEFVETSAKDGSNINKIFEILGKDLKLRLEREEKQNQQQQPQQSQQSFPLKLETQEPVPESKCSC